MINNLFLIPFSSKKHLKRKMKISTFLLFGVVFSLLAGNVSSQNEKISLVKRNTAIIEVLNEIESQTDYLFVYDKKNVDTNKNISIYADKETVASVLNNIFKGTNIIYKVEGSHIILTKNNISTISQQTGRKITGTILDSKGEPIIGANVVVKGGANGAITDIDGKFTLENIRKGNIIQISYIGYVTQEITYNDQTNLLINLKEDLQTLDEVVVVGYGIQKKVNLTGSVVSVDMDKIKTRQVSQTSMALQGAVPGLTIQQTSGQPGDDGGTMRIRGITTLNNQDPLLLVDGVEMPINSLDPSWIESISVLKDAAASAIYGSRAANGVILVKTKRASQESLSVSYNGWVGWQSATKTPKKVNALDHMRLLNVANTNAGITTNFTEEYINEYASKRLTDPDNYPDTDWLDELMSNDGFMQNHQIILSGGTKKVKAIGSIGYLEQNGLIENLKLKRYTMRLNTDYEINRNLSAQLDIFLGMNKRYQPSRTGTEAFRWAIRVPATQQSVLSNGQWGQGWNGDNPVAFAKDGGLEKKEDPSAIINLGLTYKPLDWIVVQGNYNANYYQNFRSTFNKAVTSYNPDGSVAYTNPTQSSLIEYIQKGLTNQVTLTGTASRSFGNHGFTILFGYEQRQIEYTNVTATRKNYIYPEYPVLNAGGTDGQLNTGTGGELSLRSYFGRLGYDYAGKYLFEANLRYDGTSRFASNKRWGAFPSFSVGWRISEESFMEKMKGVLNNLKLRASWGKLGNQDATGYYPYFQYVSLGLPYVFDGVSTSGAGITQMANKELTWETTTMTGVGLDVTLWNKLNVTADWYYRKTKDILFEVDIPLSAGVSKPVQNMAGVENKGWDIDISYADKISDFNYRIAFNLSDVRNKVTRGNTPPGLTIIREGAPINAIYGYEAIGYIQPEDYNSDGSYKYATQFTGFAPGDIKYKDQLTVDTNNDGIPDANDGIINDDDKVVIGNQIPRFTFGLSLAADYKGIDFSMLLQGVGKRDGYLYGQGIMPFYVGGTAMEIHKDYWTETNRNASFPRLYFNTVNNTEHSSFWKKSAAYVRLKNIQIGYTIPKDIAKKIYLDNVRFYLSGENLLTFTDFWEGYDPEAPVGIGNFYPMCKVVSFGVQVRF